MKTLKSAGIYAALALLTGTVWAEETGEIDFDDGAQTVEDALNGLPGIISVGGVTVAKANSTWTVTFNNPGNVSPIGITALISIVNSTLTKPAETTTAGNANTANNICFIMGH